MVFMSKKQSIFKILFGLIIVLIFGLGSLFGFLYAKKQGPGSESKIKNKQVAFLNEVYNIIEKNHWQTPEDQNLDQIMILGVEKLTGQPQNIDDPNREKAFSLVEDMLTKIDGQEKKNEFAASLADIILANLKPLGRSRLYTQKQEQELSNTVKNIDPSVDQYEALGVEKQATTAEIDQAYEEKQQQATSETEKQALKQAYQTLSDDENRQRYDQSGVNPTLIWEIYTPDILHIHLTKFSPTTVEDLQNVMKKAATENSQLNTLIFNLSDNIGGAIDYLPIFLGPFIGQGQYAYQFIHQGEIQDFKTKIGWMPEMVRYKKVVVLINNQTQSSAEVVAATLKKYNVGVLVGTTTKGWGSVERVFTLENQLSDQEKHSVFLVHSLTLSDSGQPIEESGISPLININETSWPNLLNTYFNYPRLTEVIKDLLKNKLY